MPAHGGGEGPPGPRAIGTVRLTSRDVARRAGVSRSTVSLVLNRSASVAISEETRSRVFRAAAELGYKPNSAARMLVSGSSETIGLIVSDPAVLLVDQFVPQVLYGIEKANREKGFHVLVEGLEPNDREDAYDHLAVSRRIDGLIVVNPRAGDRALSSLIERDFPVVLVGSVRHPAETSVVFRTRTAIAAAVDHVVGLGHRRIGAVTFSPRGFVSTDARLAALASALARHGLALDDDAVGEGDFSAESGHRSALTLLRRRPDLTAVFAGNDTIAIGVLGAAARIGRRVPADLSVVGFDDLPVAPWLTPPLTTIRTNGVEQGMLAAKMLFARLSGEPLENPRVQLEPELVLRGSTGPA